MAQVRRPPTRVLLARHGQTESNRAGLFCGHSETKLTELGVGQSRALGERLVQYEIAAVYTSDFSRAMDTAAIALERRDVQLEVDPALREIHYGEWEMQRERVVARSGAPAYALLRAEDPAWQPPGGETLPAVRARMLEALGRILRRHAHETTLVVTHGTALNCLLAGVLGMDLAYTFRIAIGNCALSEITVERGKPIVTLVNDRAHLAGLNGRAA
jgi:broad specificity phosphatase PhoE